MNFFFFFFPTCKKKGRRIVKGGAISSAPITPKLVKGHKNHLSKRGKSRAEERRGGGKKPVGKLSRTNASRISNTLSIKPKFSNRSLLKNNAQLIHNADNVDL